MLRQFRQKMRTRRLHQRRFAIAPVADDETQEWEEEWLLLSKMPLLQTLDESERGRIAEVLEAQQIEPGQPIVTVGEAGDAMYFLEAGEALAEVRFRSANSWSALAFTSRPPSHDSFARTL